MAPQFFGKGATDFGLAGKYAAQLNASTKPAFTLENPSQYLQYKQSLLNKGYKPEDVNAAMQQFAPSASSQTSEGRFIEGLMPLMQKRIEQDLFLSSPEGMKIQLQMAREEAKEKGKQGLLFNTLAKLPETLASAVSPYGGPVGAAMAYQGVAAIPGVYSSTLANYPQLQIPGSSTQQYRYF
jgi:hypothetical protein